MTAYVDVTIRCSSDDDGSAIRRLAELDSACVPCGRLLVAVVDGEIRAAVTFDGRTVIANPFHATRHLVDLIEISRRQAFADQREAMTRRNRFLAHLAALRHGPSVAAEHA